jgi:hypothetical protein
MKERLAAAPAAKEVVPSTPIYTSDPKNTFIHCGKVYTRK